MSDGDGDLYYLERMEAHLRADQERQRSGRLTETLVVRLTPAMKDWVLAHGGSALVRVMLQGLIDEQVRRKRCE